MSQKTMSRVLNNYSELIQNNIRGNIMKDPLFICADCGRLKSRDVDLSGTLCSTCSITSLTLDAKINRFTSMVKLIHLDTEYAQNKVIHLDSGSAPNKVGGFQTSNTKENLTVFDSIKNNFLSPSIKKAHFKTPKSRVKSSQQNEESAQTDLSFHPMDDVTFVIKQKHSKEKVILLKESSKLENNELRVSSDSQSSQENTEKLQSAQKIRIENNSNRDINEFKESSGSQSSQGNTKKLQSAQKVRIKNNSNRDINEFKESSGSQSSQGNAKKLQSAQVVFENNDPADIAEEPSRHQAPDSGPEVIESSVDDWLMPKQIPSSPILFSPEAKGEESDIDEYVGATPVKDTRQMNEDEDTGQRNEDEDTGQRNEDEDTRQTNEDEDTRQTNEDTRQTNEDEDTRQTNEDTRQTNEDEDTRQTNEDTRQRNEDEDTRQRNEDEDTGQRNEDEDTRQRNEDTRQRNEDEDTDRTTKPVEQDRMSDSEEEIGDTRMEKANDVHNAIEVDTHAETEDDGSSGNDVDEIVDPLLEIEAESEDVGEEQLLSQVVRKVSKYNVNLVTSSVEGDDQTLVEAFVKRFNPVVDSDVNQHTDFLIVGVDSENKVLKRTPKFLKAISLHTCIVNTEYIQKCCLQNDIVPLEKRFIPLDSSGVSGPLCSIVRQDQQLLANFVFFSLERTPSLTALIESLILHNGGKIIVNIKLFNAYDSADDSVGGGKTVHTAVRKVLVYGDNEEEQLTAAYKKKVQMAFKCQCFHYKILFNVIAGYDIGEFDV